MNQHRIIGLTGGIGSGKSVVRDIVSAMGIPVYDCDSRAKYLMDTSIEILSAIAEDICPEAIIDNIINRSVLAEHVFASEEVRLKLNRVVHRVVVDDLTSWTADKPISLIESAILYTSRLDRCVTEVWKVDAPLEVRIGRIRKRNPNLTAADITARIESQKEESVHQEQSLSHIIVNDGFTAILPRIEKLLLFKD